MNFSVNSLYNINHHQGHFGIFLSYYSVFKCNALSPSLFSPTWHSDLQQVAGPAPQVCVVLVADNDLHGCKRSKAPAGTLQGLNVGQLDFQRATSPWLMASRPDVWCLESNADGELGAIGYILKGEKNGCKAILIPARLLLFFLQNNLYVILILIDFILKASVKDSPLHFLLLVLLTSLPREQWHLLPSLPSPPTAVALLPAPCCHQLPFVLCWGWHWLWRQTLQDY